ncbi:MAG TPA: DMT family protein [Planctomycetota bacterium]|nr:DMT family protein [Planctomycetota bacterium]
MPPVEASPLVRLFPPVVQTVVLLIISNLFMTAAWYGHLKYPKAPLVLAILASWGIAFAEYCFQVPANRIGNAGGISLVQLKTIQEVITLLVFAGFYWLYFDQKLSWNHAVGFAFIVLGVFFVYLKWTPPQAG